MIQFHRHGIGKFKNLFFRRVSGWIWMLPSAGDLKFVFYPFRKGRFLFFEIAILKALLFYLVNYFHRFKINQSAFGK